MGKVTVEQLYDASGLSLSDFWDALKKEIDAGRIEKVRKGNLILLEVKN